MANLTQQEFLAIAAQNATTVNLWCTTGSIAIIKGLTIPTLDNSVPPVNIESTLRQLDTIYVPVDDGANEVVQLEVTERTSITSPQGNYYFYNTQPVDITTYTEGTNESLPNRTVIISPGISGQVFQLGNYDVLANNVEQNRQSTVLTIQGSSVLAQAQDSLYSDTGWINARYQGTPTSRLTYVGVDSTLTGGSFEGTLYALTVLDTAIQNQEPGERSYETFFHTGVEAFPSYTTGSEYYGLVTNQLYSTVLQINATLNKPLPAVGDILRIYSLGTTDTGEIIKVQAIEDLITPGAYILTVIRGWNQTQQVSIGSSYGLRRINKSEVFKLQGSQAIGNGRGKLRIKQTGDIIYLDQLGQVVSASIAPIV
jgi:hypothetical protein